jgi:di/tripeptidase
MLFYENRLLYSMCLNDTKIEIVETNNTINNLQSTLDKISTEQKQNANQLTTLNTGVSNVSSSINTTLDTNKTLLKYIKDHGELWKSKYPIIQTNMDVMDKKLTKISNNTKPLQYRYDPNIVNV